MPPHHPWRLLALGIAATVLWIDAAEPILVRLTPAAPVPSAAVSGMPFEGRLRQGDRELTIRLWATHGHGRIGEVCGEGDDPSVAAARLQYVDPDAPAADLWFPLARTVAIAGTLYRAAAATEGEATARSVVLELTPADVPLHTVRLTGTGVVSLLVCSGDRFLRLRPVDSRIQLPVGTWQVRESVVQQDGIEYRAKATAYGTSTPGTGTLSWANTAAIEVKEDGPTDVALGGPIQRVLTVRTPYTAPVLSLGAFTGQAPGGTLTYDPQGVDGAKPPRWEVRRPGGRVVASGAFEYG